VAVKLPQFYVRDLLWLTLVLALLFGGWLQSRRLAFDHADLISRIAALTYEKNALLTNHAETVQGLIRFLEEEGYEVESGVNRVTIHGHDFYMNVPIRTHD
jgi:hypothetical protein